MLKIKIIISLRQFLYQTGKGSMKEECEEEEKMGEGGHAGTTNHYKCSS